MNPAALSLLVCLCAAALEGALPGAGVRRGFAELQLPTYSPPFALWIVIGVLYYALCFLLLWLLVLYCAYLCYATWWGHRLWRLNTPTA